jgi:hypothetical protein
MALPAAPANRGEGHLLMPLRHYIFNALAALSLLLLLATVGLWVDSGSSETGIVYTFDSGDGQLRFDSKNGSIFIWHNIFMYPGTSGWTAHHHDIVPDAAGMFSRITEFHLTSSDLQFPHCFLALIFTIFPAIWLFKWNKRRKLGPNACPDCGYDLRGNESGVCPECGGGLCQR